MNKNEINLILVSGTGQMGLPIMEAIHKHPKLILPTFAFTGSDVTAEHVMLGDKQVKLIKGAEIASYLNNVCNEYGPAILIDAIPEMANPTKNAMLYSQFGLPIIEMSAGVKLNENIHNTLFVPNCEIKFVAFENFLKSMPSRGWRLDPAEYKLKILESHQASKGKEISSTARKYLPHFTAIGPRLEENQIISVRDIPTQLSLGIPEEYLGGHALHEYAISSEFTDDQRLIDMYEEFISFLHDNPLFHQLAYEEFPIGNGEFDQSRTTFFSKEQPCTFMLGVEILLKRNYSKIKIFTRILGRQPYVDGLINHAIPFMQAKIAQGLKGENWGSEDLYQFAMKQCKQKVIQ